MKNIKDITISIFAIIGFIALVTGFTNKTETQQPTQLGTPESHVWELIEASGRGTAINKVTGEVKLYVRDASKNGKTTGLKEYKAIPTPYGKTQPY